MTWRTWAAFSAVWGAAMTALAIMGSGILRVIRSDMARMAENMCGLRTEMLAVRHHAGGTKLQQDVHHEDIASLKVRLDRIEKR